MIFRFRSIIVQVVSMATCIFWHANYSKVTIRNNYMHVRIIWALSFWSTSNFNGSLWGEYMPFWVTPAQPSTSKSVHLPLAHLPERTFLTHQLPVGKDHITEAGFKWKIFCWEDWELCCQTGRWYGRINLKPILVCHLFWDTFIAILTLNVVYISVH